MTFYVGQKVVCVDDVGKRCFRIKNGRVYTVCSINNAVGVCWLRLAEASPEHGGFNSRRFRPLTDRKSSVSFTMGADPESERYDNRKTKERVR